MNNFGERIQEVMSDLGFTKAKDLAAFCGVSGGMVSQWLSNAAKLGPKPMEAFADKTEYRMAWLLYGELPKYRTTAQPMRAPATLGKRLQMCIDLAGIDAHKLESLSEVPYATIDRILRDAGKKAPEAHTLAPLADACNVRLEWLQSGEGPITKPAKANVTGSMRPITLVDDDDPAFFRVPMVNSVRLQGGLPVFAFDEEEVEHTELLVSRKWVESKGYNPGNLYALLVTGDSMYPTIKRGNTVIINTGDRRPIEGEYFAIQHEGSAVIKRLERDAGMWFLASDNNEPRYGRRAVTDTESHIIGRMVKLEQDF